MNFLFRVARGGMTLYVVLTAVFLLGRISGDPTNYLLPPDIGSAEREDLRQLLGLNDGLLTQYARYLQNVAVGDFGRSFLSSRPASEVFLERLPASISLMAPSLLFAIIFGISAGLLAAVNRGKLVDRILMAASFISQSMPSFVLGIALILLFSLVLKILPSSGNSGLLNYIMPVATLSAILAASIARLTRASLLEVLHRPFITFARARGLRPSVVIIVHALRNALLPILTLVGMQIGTLIGGAAVVETVFAWPGIGRLLVDSVIRGDYPVLQFGVIILAATVIVCNLLVDASYALLDPRLRSGGAA